MVGIKNCNFAKADAFGNKILVLDARNFYGNIPKIDFEYDQLMLLGKNSDVTIYNIDGSQAGACGNGMRALSQFLHYKEGLKNTSFTVGKNSISCKYISDNIIEVAMPEPSFEPADIGLVEELKDLTKVTFPPYPLPDAVVLSVGNPHAVMFFDNLPSMYLICELGRQVENHRYFKNRCNVSFARALSKTEIELVTWERGAGLTKACGSASCATQVAAYTLGLVEETVTVKLLEGELTISWKPGKKILMQGAIKMTHYGEIDLTNGNILNITEV